ncbi:hypothetical protein C8K44_11210 [Aminobacter sp. AP02]|nr:hypothetical protein C8K44_11210 [Aminobacter sp. AP02]
MRPNSSYRRRLGKSGAWLEAERIVADTSITMLAGCLLGHFQQP